MTGRFILVGCSHTANSGFDKNIDKHYVNLLHTGTQRKIINLAIGGMSNNEIFNRIVEYVLNNTIDQDDIVIVQWSDLHRLWVYESDNNVDDYTQITPVVCGNGDLSIAEKYHRLYVSRYNNQYMHLKHWLIKMIILQQFFWSKDIRYLFVAGFDNLLSDLDVFRGQQITNLQDTSISTNLQKILDFGNRPDCYIIEKINAILNLYNQLDFAHCLKFGEFSFGRVQLDLADDGYHYGAQTNAIWAREILSHLSALYS
jgi:hypothetical protein